MDDLLEARLHETYAEHDAVYDPTVAAERLRARGYHPRPSRRRRLWASVATAGTALTGGAVVAIALLSSGAPAAYAGWTPVPSGATQAAVTAATVACNDANGSAVLVGSPVLTDARGIYTAAVFVSGDTTQICISDGQRDNSGLEQDRLLLTLFAAPQPDQITPPGGGSGTAQGFGQPTGAQLSSTLQTLQRLPGSAAQLEAIVARGLETDFVGLAGKDVSAVAFVFADGSTVDATVQNGWYFAWWPGWSDPTSVQVTTPSGTLSAPMPSGKPCPPGSGSCGVFAQQTSLLGSTTTTTTATTSTPGSAPATTAETTTTN